MARVTASDRIEQLAQRNRDAEMGGGKARLENNEPTAR